MRSGANDGVLQDWTAPETLELGMRQFRAVVPDTTSEGSGISAGPCSLDWLGLLVGWVVRRTTRSRLRHDVPDQLPEPGPNVICTLRFCGSRTPSAVSTSGRSSPK